MCISDILNCLLPHCPQAHNFSFSICGNSSQRSTTYSYAFLHLPLKRPLLFVIFSPSCYMNGLTGYHICIFHPIKLGHIYKSRITKHICQCKYKGIGHALGFAIDFLGFASFFFTCAYKPTTCWHVFFPSCSISIAQNTT